VYEERIPYLGGRNFIESIVYTLTYLEFQNRLETGRENIGFLVQELERQLCGLARAMPQIKQIYHAYVGEALREAFKDYPLPELGSQCQIRHILYQWFTQNLRKLFPREISLVHPEELKRKAQHKADTILYEAIMGALYKSGVISHAKG